MLELFWRAGVFLMRKGVLYGIGAYLIWGFFPLYIKLLKSVPPMQILGHRIFWSFLFLVILIFGVRQWGALRKSAGSLRVIGIYTLTATLLALNWLTYIYAVNSNQVLESSLGYFINPLVNVLFGVVFLRERLRTGQWLCVGLAAAGVAYLTFDYGRLPWIALVLAVTFGLYGLIKKIAPLNSLNGLTLETAILLIPAFGFLFWSETQGIGSFGASTLDFRLILALSGIITAVPLLMFGAAARSIPLSLLGILQYIAPTGQFLLGVLVFHETLSPARLVGFVIIWIALALFWGESRLYQKSTLAAQRQ